MTRSRVTIGDRREWARHGRCVDSDPTVFFPLRGESTLPAKAICAGCPVREQCLDYALDNHETFGVWGGASERERRRMRRQRKTGEAA